jgi:hypothetical protein
MKTFNEIICEASDRLSKDFEVGVNVLSNQTRTWLKNLDSAVERWKLSYDQCRDAARKFKLGDFEGALKTIWKGKLDVEVKNSENGGNTTVKTYTIDGYATFTERIEYKNGSFAHSITGRYDENPTPGYSLGTIISVYGKGEGHNVESVDDRLTKEALAARNTANIYNILFVGCDIQGKFISKPMLKLKKSL